MSENTQIPTYTKVGFRITLILLGIITIFIARNCYTSVKYGRSTSEQEIALSYEKGYVDGRKRAGGEVVEKVTDVNPVLQKSYMKGFRNGRDDASRKATGQ